jgi:hypothetical protein
MKNQTEGRIFFSSNLKIFLRSFKIVTQNIIRTFLIRHVFKIIFSHVCSISILIHAAIEQQALIINNDDNELSGMLMCILFINIFFSKARCRFIKINTHGYAITVHSVASSHTRERGREFNCKQWCILTQKPYSISLVFAAVNILEVNFYAA